MNHIVLDCKSKQSPHPPKNTHLAMHVRAFFPMRVLLVHVWGLFSLYEFFFLNVVGHFYSLWGGEEVGHTLPPYKNVCEPHVH